MLLYAEVGNFKSELVADGQYRTLLKSTLEIVEGGPTGRVVEILPLAPSEDRCRNQRRDYYHSYDFSIPQSCNPGPHTLRLRVEDQLIGALTADSLRADAFDRVEQRFLAAMGALAGAAWELAKMPGAPADAWEFVRRVVSLVLVATALGASWTVYDAGHTGAKSVWYDVKVGEGEGKGDRGGSYGDDD